MTRVKVSSKSVCVSCVQANACKHVLVCACVSVSGDVCSVGLRGVCVCEGGGSQQYDTTSFIHWGGQCVCYSWDAHALNTTRTHTQGTFGKQTKSYQAAVALLL